MLLIYFIFVLNQLLISNSIVKQDLYLIENYKLNENKKYNDCNHKMQSMLMFKSFHLIQYRFKICSRIKLIHTLTLCDK